MKSRAARVSVINRQIEPINKLGHVLTTIVLRCNSASARLQALLDLSVSTPVAHMLESRTAVPGRTVTLCCVVCVSVFCDWKWIRVSALSSASVPKLGFTV